MVDSRYISFYCPIHEGWSLMSEYVPVPNGFKVRGHIAFGMCKKCRDKIRRLKAKKNAAK